MINTDNMPPEVISKIIAIDPFYPEPSLVSMAGQYLRAGKKVIFPTETVYGLGVNAENEPSILEVYDIKKRPRDKPFSYHFASLDEYFRFSGNGCDADAREWFHKLIPHPVTLIYYDNVRKIKIGVRIPDHPVAKAILKEAGCPVLAPSANFSGDPPPVSIDEINPLLAQRMDLIVDSGKTDNLKESTVIDISVNPVKVLRQGAYIFNG
ncbi:MAG: threonylcarbamoyl-AMP synthase [Candidatus Aureabacteria bacterium]|nr:threonylcarbamoyl-AMP synthase [Candidatus Auribacterota bacterium]